MAWLGNKGMEGGDTQGPASWGNCHDFARCSSFISDPGTSQVSSPPQGRQGRKQPEKYENSMHEAREKVCELRRCQNGAFCLRFTLGEWPAPLCAYLVTKRSFMSALHSSDKDQGPAPATGLQVPPTPCDPEDAQHRAGTRLLLAALPLQTGLKHFLAKFPLHFTSSIPRKLKQLCSIMLRHKG